MPYFKTKDGCSIYYETQAFESSKPVVAFLNGTMQNTVYWRTHCLAFKDRFRVLMYDARAQGKSDLGEGKLSLEGHAEDFFALLKHLRVDKLVKSPKTVMPDLIRHPEAIEFTGFRLSPE